MNKLLAVAALVASSFAVPALPVSAAPVLTDAQSNCLIFPMFKKECWQMGASTAMAATTTVAAATETATDEMTDGMKWPVWWHCGAAAAGSGHLIDCKK